MPTDRPAHGSAGNRGSSPVGAAAPARSRRRLLALILGAIVVLAVIALLLSRCGSSTDSTSDSPTSSAEASASTSSDAGTTSPSAPASSSPSPSPAATTPAGPAAGAAGTVTAGTQSVLEAAASANPAAALAALTGQPVTAAGVQVLSVPADEGFWVGTSDADRVWVQLTGDGESGYQVLQGDTVDFAGTLVAHDPTFAAAVGVDEAEGATQLTTQAQHVEVAKDAVTLSA